MMRTLFDRELDTIATFWRVYRRDGVALGFTSHDLDLRFGGILHRSAPGFTPAAIRKTSALRDDDAEVEGALSHDTIREVDLAAGLYDAAAVEIGAVDWETLDSHTFYSGTLGQVRDDKHGFSAELKSAKAILDQDLVPRTSPTCRAEFCGHGCSLSAIAYTKIAVLSSIDLDGNRVQFDDTDTSLYTDGEIRFLSGPQTGSKFGVIFADQSGFLLDRPLGQGIEPGMRAELLQGCDHTLATCADRFANSANFRGEPFLPGNDLLARYGRPST